LLAAPFPPADRIELLACCHDLSDAWRKDINAALASGDNCALDWLVPGMKCQVERAPVHWQHASRLQREVGFDCLFWLHVDIQPILPGTVGADLQQAQIERSQTIADFSEMRTKTVALPSRRPRPE
jgi:hypothetical protein